MRPSNTGNIFSKRFVIGCLARMNEKLSATSCHFVELEGDELGNHPCLAQLVAVVKHMESKHMYTVPTDSYENADPPLWMKSILAVLESEEHHRNIKLFILKIILTVPDIFVPFAKIFQLPILNLIGDGVLTDSGNSINYFISDLIIMLLSWSKQTGIVPDKSEREKITTARVLSFLMRSIHHERRDTSETVINYLYAVNLGYSIKFKEKFHYFVPEFCLR